MNGVGVRELALDWQLHPGIAAWCLAAAALYVLGARGRAWPVARTGSFLAGLAIVAVALQSGLDAHAEELLSVHMLQHLLLTLAAPPLLIAGAPVTLALRALPPSGRRVLASALRSRPLRGLAHPAVGLALFAAVLLVTHFTGFYDAALRSTALHESEHVLYVATALLFWLPLAGREPLRARPSPLVRILYVLLAMPPMALVGVALASSDTLRYESYASPAQALGVSALADQHAGGMIMWVGGTLTLALAVVWIGWSALRREEELQRARDAYADRRVAAGGPLR